MSIAIIDSLKNLKIKYKIFVILAVLFIFIINLGVLNTFSVRDIQKDTQQISDELIPRLIETSSIKDNINLATLSAVDYIQSGNTDSKTQYESHLQQAVISQIRLFEMSSSNADFEFTTSFESHINNTNSSLQDLIDAFERGATAEELAIQLETVNANRDAFSQFLETEIEEKVQILAAEEREQTASRVQQTTIIVIVIIVLTLLALLLIYIFSHRTITKPIEELTAVAQDITEGNVKPVNIDNTDELGVFAETFNTMIQKLQATHESLTIELEKTKELDRQKSEFLAVAAHELRTPISGIKWLLNMTVQGDLGDVAEEAKEQLAKGIENVDRMTRTINNLLEVAEIEADELRYELTLVDVNMLIEESMAMFEHNAQEAGVTLTADLAGSDGVKIYVDKEKMSIVVNNLIDNAIHYTPEKGSITIQTESDGEDVLIHIQDNGYGIPKDEQERVFSKLYRGSNVERIWADGTGLGLFISQSITKQHEGEITFESEQDKGTMFTVELPVPDLEEVEKEIAEKKRKAEEEEAKKKAAEEAAAAEKRAEDADKEIDSQNAATVEEPRAPEDTAVPAEQPTAAKPEQTA